MSEKKYTEDEVNIKTQMAKMETKLDILIDQFDFSKKIFWRLFAPGISGLSIISGIITSIYLKAKQL